MNYISYLITQCNTLAVLKTAFCLWQYHLRAEVFTRHGAMKRKFPMHSGHDALIHSIENERWKSFSKGRNELLKAWVVNFHCNTDKAADVTVFAVVFLSPLFCFFWICMPNADVMKNWERKKGGCPAFLLFFRENTAQPSKFSLCQLYQVCTPHVKGLSLKVALLKFVCLLSW